MLPASRIARLSIGSFNWDSSVMRTNRSSKRARCNFVFAFCLLPSALLSAQRVTGITAAANVARAYDLILDANFDELKATLPSICPPAPMVACRGLEALGL